jgi:CBS domain containing-hemolysin-like protein
MWSSGQNGGSTSPRGQAGWQECVVINHNRVVLGLLNREAWLAGDELPAEEAMDPAPLTLRPHFLWESVLEKMRTRKTDIALVTKPDGKLIGMLRQNATH